MEYTTDTSQVVEDFLRTNRDDARNNLLDVELEAKAIEFCAVLRVLDGKEDDPELIARAAGTRERADAEALRRDRFAGKLKEPKVAPVGPDPFDVARRDAVAARIGQIENEHAAHAALRDLNAEAGFEAEAEKHAATMLELDGFHEALLAELSSLSARIPADDTEGEVAPTKRTGRPSTKKG